MSNFSYGHNFFGIECTTAPQAVYFSYWHTFSAFERTIGSGRSSLMSGAPVPHQWHDLSYVLVADTRRMIIHIKRNLALLIKEKCNCSEGWMVLMVLFDDSAAGGTIVSRQWLLLRRGGMQH